ncbi:MAG: hypothetical protein KDC95_16020 [Planctomycetes bacterium]|nr:hypothetical protein [Planctomycetota bacterium]
MALCRVLQSSERILETITGVPVRVACPAANAPAPWSGSEIAFAAEFRLEEHEWAIGIDTESRRALVDACAIALSGYVAAGELSEVELGILEGIALLVFGNLVTALRARDVRWSSSLHGAAAAELCESYDQDPLPIHIRIAGRDVYTQIFGYGLPDFRAGLAELEQLPELRPPERCVLRIHGPPIHLNPDEHSMLVPGSIVLLGAPDLASHLASCTLRSDSGWHVASAEVLHDRAHAMRVRLSDPHIKAPSDDETTLCLGSVQLHARELLLLRRGSELTLVRSAVDSLSLAGGRRLPVEALRYDGELALRVLNSEET